MTRLIVLLLSLLLALPAAAAPPCHPHATTEAHAMHHAPAPPAATVAHDCIGCIPPSDWLAARIAAPLVPIAQIRPRAPSAWRAGVSTRPTPPPPRAV